MSVIRTLPEAIVDLDRRVSRAIAKGRGIGLTRDQLDALAAIGLIERLAEAKASILKEQARCRQTKEESISGAASGSTMSGPAEARPPAGDCTSGGTIPRPGAFNARARARRIFD